MVKANWCGDMNCAESMEKALDRTFLGYPLKGIDSGEVETSPGGCYECGSPTDMVVLLSRSY